MPATIPDYDVFTVDLSTARTDFAVFVNARQIFFNEVPADISVKVGSPNKPPITISKGERRKLVLCGPGNTVDRVFITSAVANGELEIFVSEEMDATGFSKGGDASKYQVLAQINQTAWNQTARSVRPGAQENASATSETTAGTGAAFAMEVQNGIRGLHLNADPSADNYTSVLLTLSNFHVNFRNIFNPHGLDLPVAPNWRYIFEDTVYVASSAGGGDLSSHGVFGVGVWNLNGTTGAETRSGFFFEVVHTTGSALANWRVGVIDASDIIDFETTEFSADIPRTLRLEIGLEGGTPTARFFIDGTLVRTITGPLSVNLDTDGNWRMHWHAHKKDDDSVQFMNFAILLHAGATLAYEQY